MNEILLNQFRKVQKNKIFKFFSSVKLAVPLLLTLATIVACGTILEARYNADYARLMIYQTRWFYCLLGLLWINILFAALSRIPWKRTHTGFVITHLGLLTLIVGSFLTSVWGVDGQLRINEGATESTVFLSDLSLEVVKEGDSHVQTLAFDRKSSKMNIDNLSYINDELSHILTAKEFIPFAKVEEKFVEGDPGNSAAPNYAIGIWLKSNFFSVSEWLNTQDKSEVQMGPAKIRLIIDSPVKIKANTTLSHSGETLPKKIIAKAKPKKAPVSFSGAQLVVTDAQGQVLQQIKLAKLMSKPATVKNVKISIVKTFEQAQVVSNKLAEGGGKGLNPALELKLEQDGKILREVSYAKFASFSLNTAPPFGLKFQYQYDEATVATAAAEPAEAEMADTMVAPAAISNTPGDRTGNVIEFHINPLQDQQVRVELYKDNQNVMTKVASSGNIVDTPWMGMRITLGSIVKNSSKQAVVTETEVPEKSDLPPSAILIQPKDSKSNFWLVENTSQKFQSGNQNYEVYYGKSSLKLPFALKLEKFYKKDYPGTETPMSYESHVQVNGQGDTTVISMNEPLKKDGFTLYQASYQMGSGEPTASIFSVNRDPGRPFKYLGGIILAIGIITFTYIRSGFYKDLQAKMLQAKMLQAKDLQAKKNGATV